MDVNPITNLETFAALQEEKGSITTLLMSPNPDVKKKYITWASIKPLEKLPFLQISLAGILLYGVELNFVNSLTDLTDSMARGCRGLLDDTRNFLHHLRWSANCKKFSDPAWLESLRHSVQMQGISLFLIFLSSLMQKLFCPPVIMQYSLLDWQLTLRRPLEFYYISSILRPHVMGFTVFMYFLGFSVFLMKFLPSVLFLVL